MAYDDSEALQPNSTYNLGGYTFELKVQNVHEPGEEEVVSVFAICRSPDGTRETVPMDFPAGTTVESWSVEANETEASIYVTVQEQGESEEGGKKSSIIDYTVPVVGGYFASSGETPPYTQWWYRGASGAATMGYFNTSEKGFLAIWASANPNVLSYEQWYGGVFENPLDSVYTYDGKTVYYTFTSRTMRGTVSEITQTSMIPEDHSIAGSAWTLIYGEDVDPKDDGKEHLVARFAIDIREADGGPDGDWDEPGDTGDPSYTLNVSVTGASSGSNSGIPLEAQEQTTYGSGGYGGNGGGGGAGASTVIIYEFATDKAGTVNQEATAQAPGTGGPGGKGGKGGDGCILIFY